MFKFIYCDEILFEGFKWESINDNLYTINLMIKHQDIVNEKRLKVLKSRRIFDNTYSSLSPIFVTMTYREFTFQ